MRLLFLISILSFLMTSCVTQEKCNRLFPPTVTVKDSIITKETIKWKDTTITIPGERVVIKDFVWCDSLRKAQLPKKSVKSGSLTATVEIKDGEIKVDCKAASLQKVIQLQEKTIETLKTHSSTEVRIDKEYFIRWYDHVTRWGFLIFVAATLVYFKFLKR